MSKKTAISLIILKWTALINSQIICLISTQYFLYFMLFDCKIFNLLWAGRVRII